ncbi:hypothetical protein FBU30_001839 [Linnemannia zychae]|nr:hypothetical protein FBU30_001839 [Linnemannia zychae]
MNNNDDYDILEDQLFESENESDEYEEEMEYLEEEQQLEEVPETSKSEDEKYHSPYEDHESMLRSTAVTPSRQRATTDDNFDSIPPSPLKEAAKRAEAREHQRKGLGLGQKGGSSGMSTPTLLPNTMPNYRGRTTTSKSFCRSEAQRPYALRTKSPTLTQQLSKPQAVPLDDLSPFVVSSVPTNSLPTPVQSTSSSGTAATSSPLDASRTTRVTQREKPSFSRHATAPDLTDAIPGSPSVLYTPRQKVALYENE